MDKYLTYIDMGRAGLTVEEVISTIRHKQTQLKATTGSGFDLVIDDYPGILTTSYFDGKKAEHRITQDYIYRQFVQLALEERFHVILAAQTNREGSKINRGQDHERHRLLTLEDIAEAFGISQSATNFITLNRSERDKHRNRMTFYVCKSRSSSTGWAVVTQTDFNKSLTHGPTLKAVAYHSSMSPDESIEKFLENNDGQDVSYS
jgi:hypothetical protein